MRTSRVPRPAALLLGLGLLVGGSVAAPAALAVGQPADDVPDLTISTNAYNSIYPGRPATWTITLGNPGYRVWDAELHRYYTGGSPVYNVVVKDTLPTGSQVVSASGDSGFSCSQASGVVTCSGGSLQIGGVAHITINSIAPTVEDWYTNTATVDPNNAIPERNENNNTMSTNVYVSWFN
jgi:hypothetical protein